MMYVTDNQNAKILHILHFTMEYRLEHLNQKTSRIWKQLKCGWGDVTVQ